MVKFYDSKKQYFPFTVEEIIEYVFITMMIDKRSLEVSQMPLTDEVLGHYINYSWLYSNRSICTTNGCYSLGINRRR